MVWGARWAQLVGSEEGGAGGFLTVLSQDFGALKQDDAGIPMPWHCHGPQSGVC